LEIRKLMQHLTDIEARALPYEEHGLLGVTVHPKATDRLVGRELEAVVEQTRRGSPAANRTVANFIPLGTRHPSTTGDRSPTHLCTSKT
jgi:hypothetical protein